MEQDIQSRAMRTAKGFNCFNGWGDRLDMEKLQKVLRRRSKVDILGAGCHGIVIDCGDYVLKFFHADDFAYLAFINFCLAYGESDYLPKIYSFHRVSQYLYAVTLEKLSPYRFENKKQKKIYGDISRLLEYSYFSAAVRDLKGYVPKRDLGLFQALRRYKNNCEEDIYSDMHEGNVMFRRGQIVITDPWC